MVNIMEEENYCFLMDKSILENLRIIGDMDLVNKLHNMVNMLVLGEMGNNMEKVNYSLMVNR